MVWSKLFRPAKWADWIATRFEAYTALTEQYPIIWRIIKAAGAAVMFSWTYLAESWLPFAIVTGVATYITLSFLPLSHRNLGGRDQNAPDDAEKRIEQIAAEVQNMRDYANSTVDTLLKHSEKLDRASERQRDMNRRFERMFRARDAQALLARAAKIVDETAPKLQAATVDDYSTEDQWLSAHHQYRMAIKCIDDTAREWKVYARAMAEILSEDLQEVAHIKPPEDGVPLGSTSAHYYRDMYVIQKRYPLNCRLLKEKLSHFANGAPLEGEVIDLG